MGKAVGGLPEAAALKRGEEDASPVEALPIGAWLARQRQLRGIGLEDLSRRTRIPRRSLERLEAGSFDERPDGFSRGFVRTVAEAIGLDPDAAVARMLAEPDAAPSLSRLAPRLRRLALLGALVTAVAGGGALAWIAWGRLLAPAVVAPAPVSPQWVRRDAVKELAREVREGALPASRAGRAPPVSSE